MIRELAEAFVSLHHPPAPTSSNDMEVKTLNNP